MLKSTMEYSDYCTACLITDVKMCISNTSVDFKLLQFLRLPLSSSKEIRARICSECAAHLRKFEKFRRKCDRAREVLSKLRQSNEITRINILNLDRNQHKLASTITLNTLDYISIDSSQIENSDIKDKYHTAYEVKLNFETLNNDAEAQEIKNESEYIQESPLHDYYKINNYNINNSTTENVQNYFQKIPKTKTDIKEHKGKKRKASATNISESVSDDEPLAKISKINEESQKREAKKNKRKNCNLKYFEDYATVVFLSPEEAKQELLLRKESSNYINSPFKCKFCYRGFEAKATFENHMKKHIHENGEYECDICHLRFPEQRHLCKHRLATHKRKFSCKLCSYVCFCTYQAKTHISLHKGKKYPCKDCGEIFSMPNSLFMHKRLKHVTECVCGLCGNTFATQRGLYSHHTKIHRQDKNEERGPKCEECRIHFATAEAWKLHLVLSSKHDVSNGCKYCGESFSNPEELKTHVRVHSRKQARHTLKLPATCTICGKYLTNHSEYASHMSAAHPYSDVTKKLAAARLAPYVCETCGLAFKKQCFLKYHQRKHTGERPYKCAECEKTFPVAGALASHRAVHSRRTHACAVCGRHFSFRTALNKHMKVHLNIRPHRCDICDKSFINPCDVRLHVKYVHNKVPWPKRDRTKKIQDTVLL